MKLSTRAEYGIRVLVALARAEGSGPLADRDARSARSCRTPTSSSWSATCAAPSW